eukprot:5469308-Prymnesium_polylepis.1
METWPVHPTTGEDVGRQSFRWPDCASDAGRARSSLAASAMGKSTHKPNYKVKEKKQAADVEEAEPEEIDEGEEIGGDEGGQYIEFPSNMDDGAEDDDPGMRKGKAKTGGF